jgi:hypothetical protein
MPLQNRVDPWGRLHAVPARGTLMGNRGILHDDNRQIVRPWKGQAWVTCELTFKGIQRQPFSKGSHSELFFLDEATALAAGHRPCFHCRPRRFAEFKSSWLAANRPGADGGFTPITQIDNALHAERAMRGGRKGVFVARLFELPDGTMFEMDGAAFLVWKRALLAWSFGGYGPPRWVSDTVPDTVSDTRVVDVLTPPSIVQMYRRGFVPAVHASAG